jgi:hypothetical protein
MTAVIEAITIATRKIPVGSNRGLAAGDHARGISL